MSRKRRTRTRSTAPIASAAASPRTVQVGRVVVAGWSGRVVPVLRYTVCVLLWAGLLLLAVSWIVVVILRGRSAPDRWPTAGEIGLSVRWAAAGAFALAVSSMAVWSGQRAWRGGRVRIARAGLATALVLAGFAVGIRVREYAALYSNGIAVWSPGTTVFDEASVYYVHAVKERLRVLARDLEARRTRRPDRFGESDRRRLELVTTLQTSLVSWTEREVGQWLDDTQLRRDLIEVMAYQIHPTAVRRDAARRRIEVERGELERRRQCFLVLRDYCRQQQAAAPRQAESVLESLRRLGADRWSFAEAVLRDGQDATMIGERLNQIDTSLASMAAREAYVRAYLDPLWDAPTAEGLNGQYSGLRLPVSLPHARAWAVGYALLTGLHSLVLALAALALLSLPPARGNRPHGVLRAMCGLSWHGAVAMGLLVFAGLYCR